jgi:L-iditol 2-dehydrogenase
VIEVRLHGVGDLRVGEAERPVPGPGESLVRVSAVGVCGSDLHWFTAGSIGDATLDRPLVPGHEFGGIVEAGPLAGRRVAVDPAIPCGTCDRCREGNHNLCPTVRFAGHGACDGALREYLVWPSHLLHPVPDTLSDEAAALLEPLGVAIHAFDLGHVRLGASVAVVGCGPIGLMLLQVARAGGAGPVVAVEPLPHRRAAAAGYRLGPAIDPGDDLDATLADTGAPGGVDVAFEVAGTDEAVTVAMRLVRPGGRVVLAGIPYPDSTTFPASLARRKGLTLAMVRRMRDSYPRALRLIGAGLVDLDSLVTHRYPLTDAAKAFAAAVSRTGIKVVIEPQPRSAPDMNPRT